jgi:hexosaminidase
VRDLDSMYRRMQVTSERLDAIGLTHHAALNTMQERLAPENVDALRVLAGVVEPVKGYKRSGTGRYTQDVALNRLPDSIPPESVVAREFATRVDRIIAGKASPDDIEAVRQWMTAWKLNDQRLAPTIQQSELLREDASVSQNLSAVGALGLQALDLVTSHSTAPAGWPAQQMTQLEAMKQPQAELLLMVVEPVEKLVQAVPAQ